MTGSALAARMVVSLGLDGVLGIGGCACAAGGLGMVAAVALGLRSSLSLVLPIAVYLAGLGMVLPQGIAGALTPFPERAGAASSLFGFVQQSIAALCGAVVGSLLGRSAWPRWAVPRSCCGLRRSTFDARAKSTEISAGRTAY